MNIRYALAIPLVFLFNNHSWAASGPILFEQLGLNGSYEDNRSVNWIENDLHWMKFLSKTWDKDCFAVKRSGFNRTIEEIFHHQGMISLYEKAKVDLSPLDAELCEASLLEEGLPMHSYYHLVSIVPQRGEPSMIIFLTQW